MYAISIFVACVRVLLDLLLEEVVIQWQMLQIHLQPIQLQLYVCYNRYASSTSAACRYGCVAAATLALLWCWELAWITFASIALVLGSCFGELPWCWDLALVSCLGGGVLFW